MLSLISLTTKMVLFASSDPHARTIPTKTYKSNLFYFYILAFAIFLNPHAPNAHPHSHTLAFPLHEKKNLRSALSESCGSWAHCTRIFDIRCVTFPFSLFGSFNAQNVSKWRTTKFHNEIIENNGVAASRHHFIALISLILHAYRKMLSTGDASLWPFYYI